jgi:uncharacterized protein (DUF1015 family)
MSRFEPFAGYRYDNTRVDLGDVVAPPYDVVGPPERARLAARSPFNSILVELPEPDEESGLDRYQSAAAILESWIAGGVLARDPEPAFYVYRMSYEDEGGHRRSTTGVVGALGLDLEGRGDVLPHEETMPKPKGDRLFLVRATRANLSPIWGLAPAPGLTAACEQAVTGREPDRAEDGPVVHELWAVSDPASLEAIRAAVESDPVLLADGHHRYETARAYRQELAGDNAAEVAATPRDLVMALVVELAEDQLLVRPIHRLVSGFPEGFDLPAALSEWFEVEPAGDGQASGAAAAAAGDERGLELVTAEGRFVLVPLPRLDEAAGVDLDSARLRVALAGLPPHEVVYQHGREETIAALGEGAAQAAFLLRPATVEQIADTARLRRLMPPKTTFFEPKPKTGMVFRILD